MSKHLEYLRNEVKRLTELERGATGAVQRLKKQRDALKAENARLTQERERLRVALESVKDTSAKLRDDLRYFAPGDRQANKWRGDALNIISSTAEAALAAKINTKGEA